MHSLDQYHPRTSLVHRLDPRIKILSVLALSIVILQANLVELGAIIGLVLVVAIMARIPSISLLRTLQPVLPFFICLFLVYAFFTPGRPLTIFSFGPVQIAVEGLIFGTMQVGKFILLVLAAGLVTMTTTHLEITMGVERLLRPLNYFKVSSHDIAIMVSLALRFIPLLEVEMHTIKEAQLARGADYNSNLIRGKIRAVTYLAMPLAMNVFRRCDGLADAMVSRGYRSGYRTYLHELRLSLADYCLLFIIVAVTIVYLI